MGGHGCAEKIGRLPGGPALIMALLLWTAGTAARAETFALYDFRYGMQGWATSPAIGSPTTSATDGLNYTITGDDSYLYSPPADYPTSEPIRLSFRMRSTGSANGEIYYGSIFSEANKRAFTIVNDGAWHDYLVVLPPLGAGARVRIDTNGPVASPSTVTITWVQAAVATVSTIPAQWDFTQGYQGWVDGHQIANSQITAEGWQFDSTGNDPWIEGPLVDYPPGLTLRVSIRMRSTTPGNAEFFWGHPGFVAGQEISFPMKGDGQFHEYSVILPALGTGWRLRLDPGTGIGAVTVHWIKVETIVPLEIPPLTPPVHPQPGAGAPLTVQSGTLTLTHYGERWGNYILSIDGVEMASGHTGDQVGYYEYALPTLRSLAALPAAVTREGAVLVERVAFTDADGGHWALTRRFEPAAREGALSVQVSAVCDLERQVVHIPWLTLFPGLGTYCENKNQALLAGIEYLANEPSSSEKDVRGSGAVRRVPAAYKFTFPLMALCYQQRCLGLSWTPSPWLAAVFDSPDRIFGSGAHVMGLWAPEVGGLRMENSLFAGGPFTMEAGVALSAEATLTGDLGRNVVPAIQAWVGQHGLPPVPDFPGGYPAAVDLMAAGFTQSENYDGAGLWSHAIGFGMGRAADAVVFCRWLAARTQDPAVRDRLNAAAAAGLAQLDGVNSNYLEGIAHDRWPMTHMLLGKLPWFLQQQRNAGFALLQEFDAQGIRDYHDRADLADTHYAHHANGYAGRALQPALEAALLTGDAALTQAAVDMLDLNTLLYADSVPRGAQTWEVPLHTPDIMASGNMVKCYVFGYELTGREEYLNQARYWAWTGLPFVYLQRDFDGPVGEYATIAVYGATSYVAPLWIGLPVQWCGLVYRNALHRLAQYDPDGPWRQVADGITVSGLLQSYPPGVAGRLGTLPDSWNLIGQSRNGPDINSGTISMGLAEAFGEGSVYGFHKAQTGWLIHAPSALEVVTDTPDAVRLRLRGWGPASYSIAVVKMDAAPLKVLAGAPGAPAAGFAPPAFTYDASRRQLFINGLTGDREVFIQRAESGVAGYGLYR